MDFSLPPATRGGLSPSGAEALGNVPKSAVLAHFCKACEDEDLFLMDDNLIDSKAVLQRYEDGKKKGKANKPSPKIQEECKDDGNNSDGGEGEIEAEEEGDAQRPPPLVPLDDMGLPVPKSVSEHIRQAAGPDALRRIVEELPQQSAHLPEEAEVLMNEVEGQRSILEKLREKRGKGHEALPEGLVGEIGSLMDELSKIRPKGLKKGTTRSSLVRNGTCSLTNRMRIVLQYFAVDTPGALVFDSEIDGPKLVPELGEMHRFLRMQGSELEAFPRSSLDSGERFAKALEAEIAVTTQAIHLCENLLQVNCPSVPSAEEAKELRNLLKSKLEARKKPRKSPPSGPSTTVAKPFAAATRQSSHKHCSCGAGEGHEGHSHGCDAGGEGGDKLPPPKGGPPKPAGKPAEKGAGAGAAAAKPKAKAKPKPKAKAKGKVGK